VFGRFASQMHQAISHRDSLLQRSIVKLQARPLLDRRIIWLSSIAGAVLVLIVYLLVSPEHRSGSVLLTVVAGIGALTFYLHRRHIEDACLVKELLADFNDRYDKMGTDLQFALSRNGDFEKETQLKFVRYFNLCAEEWLFWRAGYIYDPVWEAWRNGMKQYSRDKRVMAIWERERETNSYYGFDLGKVTSDL
jgi:hypothetical protein